MSHFKFFDSTLFTSGKPDMAAAGFVDMPIIYEGELYDGGDDRSLQPTVAKVNAAITNRETNSEGWICFDHESWHFDSSDIQGAESVTKFNQLFSDARNALIDKSIKLGNYGLAPIRDYNSSTYMPESTTYQNWQTQNDRMSGINIDFCAPILYPFVSQLEVWNSFAISSIDECRRLYPDKPVYVFLTPFFAIPHPSEGTLISSDYWHQQLRLIHSIGDGLILWSNPVAFDNASGWWGVTTDFITEVTV